MVSRTLLAGLAFVLAGCIQAPSADLGASSTPSDLPGPLALPEKITGIEALALVPIDGANDIAFKPGYAYVSAGSGTHVVDIRDPAAPVLVSSVECAGKDVGVVDLPSGRRIVTISWQGDDKCPGSAAGGGIRLVDVTDPAEPMVLPQVALVYGSHTHTPYGDTGLVFNSAYNLAGNLAASPFDHHRSEIVDITDPEAPKVATEFLFPPTSLSIGCHDILAEPERDRAICAGISETMVWDMTDPMAPKIVSTIRNPLITIHHSAATGRDGKLLVLGDEAGGVFLPGCNDPVPLGALWAYDLTDPAAPKLLGHFVAPKGRSPIPCTAHNFNFVEGTDLVVSAFYTAGTVLVDFGDPAEPMSLAQVAPDDGTAWASYYHEGAVYVGNGARGFDVLKLT